MSNVNSSEIRKVAQCVYLACDEAVAVDIAAKCNRIADSHDSQVEQIAKLEREKEMLREALKMGVANHSCLISMHNKLLKSQVTSSSLTEPDYVDGEVVCDMQKALAATEPEL